MAKVLNIEMRSILAKTCTFCKYSTRIVSHMKEHVKQFHDKIKYKYDKNFQVYRRKKRKDNRTYNQFCDLCNASFFSLKLLNRHMKSHYKINNPGRMICIKCSYVANDFHSITNHVKVSHKKDPLEISRNSTWRYSCVSCSYVTTKHKVLIKHVAKVHFNQNTCELCSFTGIDDEQLESHVISAHSNSIIHCKFCNYYSMHKIRIFQHTQAIHDMVFDWFCYDCNKGFHRKRELELHIKSKDEKYWNLTCNVCEYRTFHYRYLHNHMIRNHGKMKQCRHCTFTTSNAVTFKNHNQLMHIETTNSNKRKNTVKTDTTLKREPMPEKIQSNNSQIVLQSIKLEVDELFC